VKRSVLAVVLVLCAATASAGTITSISPASIKVNSGEHFLTLYGSGLGSVVVFDGPAGHFERNTNANFSGSVATWVPEPIVRTSGTYTVYVRGGTGDSNVVNFTVQGFKFFPFVIIVPEILRVQPLDRSGGYVKYDVFWAGGQANDGDVRCLPASGEFFKMGQTLVNCEAANSAGETAKATFVIDVHDDVAPTLYLPREPIKVKATSREGAIVQYDSKAYDDIYGDVQAVCAPKSGSVFPVGVTTVQCNATDLDENVAAGAFQVEVLGEVKWYPLDVVAPKSIVVDAKGIEGNYVDFDVKVSNGRNPEVSCYPKSGSLFPMGLTSVVCDAIDDFGMRGRGEFYVEVRDPKAPFIEKLYATPDILPNDGRVYPIEIVAGATDDFDARPVCQIFAVRSTQTIDLDDDDSEKLYDWRVTGDLTLELRGEASRVDRTYDVWVGCTDFYGNRTNSSTKVIVPVSGGQSVPTAPKRRAGPKP
jgi:HYR domain